MNRWSSPDGAVRMWTIRAGAVVLEADTGSVTVAIGGEAHLSQDTAAELAEALIEATTGKVPE